MEKARPGVANGRGNFATFTSSRRLSGTPAGVLGHFQRCVVPVVAKSRHHRLPSADAFSVWGIDPVFGLWCVIRLLELHVLF